MLKVNGKIDRRIQGAISEPYSAIKSFISDLHSLNGEIRREARLALVEIGGPAVPLLISTLKDPDDDVRWEAAKALGEIADPRAASDLVNTLMDHNFGIRWIAAEGLIAIGEAALIPLLEKITERSDSTWLRRGAHHVLRDLVKRNPSLKGLAGPVIAALEEFEPEVAVIGPAHTALDELKSAPAEK